jgi:murein L,D-transpeptidase YafK
MPAYWSSASLHSQSEFAVVLVDKAAHKIHLADYVDNKIEIKKSFHATLGKANGDKEVENDFKTPEGIYFFISKLSAPTLNKKLGKLALRINYPNPFDQLNGKTGTDIMLHATDDPTRLLKDQDSEGCVVVDNNEIEEIARYVHLGLTPIIIYPEMKPEYLTPLGTTTLKEAFERWLAAWTSKDLDTYIDSYAQNFRFGRMNLKQYQQYKGSLNKKYALIDVQADHVRYYYHPKYSAVSFKQNYSSKLKNGSKGFKSAGTKTLYFVKTGDRFKIVDESYSFIKED